MKTTRIADTATPEPPPEPAPAEPGRRESSKITVPTLGAAATRLACVSDRSRSGRAVGHAARASPRIGFAARRTCRTTRFAGRDLAMSLSVCRTGDLLAV